MGSSVSLNAVVDRIRERLPDERGLSTDDVFSILSNRRRRYTLYYLLQNGEDADMRDVVEQVAVWESDAATAPEDLNSAERKRVYTALQQNHLPKMADIGVIEYNKSRGDVEPTEQLNELDIYLDIVQGGQIPWSGLYLGLSFVSYLLILIVWVVGFPFTLLSPLAWGAVVAAVFMISSVAHLYENRQQKFSAGDAPPELNNSDE